jgi:hypothetical protein
MYVGTVCLGILVPHSIWYLIVLDWYHIDPHVIPDSSAVLLFFGGSFFRPVRVLQGTPAKGAIVTDSDPNI